MPSERQRILVIGSGGAGKTTFARELARRTGLPLIHLDLLYWRAGWEPMPEAEWSARVEALAAEERWIIDGNYGGSLPARIRRCDAVVFFDLPRWICLAGVLRRWWRHRRAARPDLPEGCDERLSLDFLRWVWAYPRESRPRIARALQAAGPQVEIAAIRNRREAGAVLERFGAPLRSRTAAQGRGS